jgi:hypothetical protein
MSSVAIQIGWVLWNSQANMVYYHVYLFQSNIFTCHCVTSQIVWATVACCESKWYGWLAEWFNACTECFQKRLRVWLPAEPFIFNSVSAINIFNIYPVDCSARLPEWLEIWSWWTLGGLQWSIPVKIGLKPNCPMSCAGALLCMTFTFLLYCVIYSIVFAVYQTYIYILYCTWMNIWPLKICFKGLGE